MLREPWRFNPDLSTAETLPSWYYLDPGVLHDENRKVFGRTWQLVGHVDQIPEPGSYFPTVIAEEPVLITRDREGTVHAMSNVCRHRAGPVLSDAVHNADLQCDDNALNHSPIGKFTDTS